MYKLHESYVSLQVLQHIQQQLSFLQKYEQQQKLILCFLNAEWHVFGNHPTQMDTQLQIYFWEGAGRSLLSQYCPELPISNALIL